MHSQIFRQDSGESSAVLDSITNRIGLAPYFEKLEGLFGEESFRAAAEGPKAPRLATRTAPTSPPAEEDSTAPDPPGPSCSAEPYYCNCDTPLSVWHWHCKRRGFSPRRCSQGRSCASALVEDVMMASPTLATRVS